MLHKYGRPFHAPGAFSPAQPEGGFFILQSGEQGSPHPQLGTARAVKDIEGIRTARTKNPDIKEMRFGFFNIRFLLKSK